MRQLWIIKLVFRYLLLGENCAAWPPQPEGLVCTPVSGTRDPISEDDSDVSLAVAAHFAGGALSAPEFRFRAPLRRISPNIVRVRRDAYGRDFVTACWEPIRLPRQADSGSLCRQIDKQSHTTDQKYLSREQMRSTPVL
jgi:hypothetical protein